MFLPPFTGDGVLKVGDYLMTLDELRGSFLVTGRGVGSGTWDTAWRSRLVDNLEVLVRQLWDVGIQNIFIDGSFVEEKDHPNDIDGYFECDRMQLASGILQQELNKRDPYHCWTWAHQSRTPDANSAKSQLPLWHRYRVELYPHYGQLCGIVDQYGNEQRFPSAFRLSRRAFLPKGIVKIVK